MDCRRWPCSQGLKPTIAYFDKLLAGQTNVAAVVA